MQEKSYFTVGGILAILIGLSYFGVGATFFLTPADQTSTDVSRFMMSLNEDSTIRTLHYLSWALGGVLALGAVPAISDLMFKNHGMVIWTRNIAILGYAVVAVGNFRAMTIKPLMAEAYVTGDEVFKTIIPSIDPWLLLDPLAILGGAGVGLWLLVINYLGIKRAIMPKTLSIIGILGGLCLILGVFGAIFQNAMVNMIASAFGGLIMGPIWFIWIGSRLMKLGKSAQLVSDQSSVKA